MAEQRPSPLESPIRATRRETETSQNWRRLWSRAPILTTVSPKLTMLSKLSTVKCCKGQRRVWESNEEVPVVTGTGQSLPFHFSNANTSEPGAKPAIHYSRRPGWFRLATEAPSDLGWNEQSYLQVPCTGSSLPMSRATEGKKGEQHHSHVKHFRKAPGAEALARMSTNC